MARKQRHSRVARKEPSGGKETVHLKRTTSVLHDLQLAKMYVLVIFCTIFCNLPNAIVLAVFRDKVQILNDVVQVKIWTVSILVSNPTFNCLIFFWANKVLRIEGWK